MARILFLLIFTSLAAAAATVKVSEKGAVICEGAQAVLRSPKAGLWAVSQSWKDNKPADFLCANPSEIEDRGYCVVARGSLKTASGEWKFKDVYTVLENGLVKCRRRFEYSGAPASMVTLKNEFSIPAETEKILIPAVIYYGNPSGYKRGADRVPTFSKKSSPDVLFEEHRLPMPFVCAEFELGGRLYSAALHTVPSKASFANVPDQWWTLGAGARGGATSLVSTSGAVVYNGKWGRVKSLQRESHAYPDTFLNVPDGAVIEKTFYISAAECPREGSGFMQAVDASLDIFEPYSTCGMPKFADIVRSKYRFSQSRYVETPDYAGFLKYPPNFRKQAIVFGWCGQAAAMGYAYQHLAEYGDAAQMRERAQKSLDFLSGSEFFSGGFRVGFDIASKKWFRGEILSQVQGLNNMMMAIASARRAPAVSAKNARPKNTLFDAIFGGKEKKPAAAKPQKMSLDPSKWEAFAKKAADFHADRVLAPEWNPQSTSEAFLCAPLALAYKLFGGDKFKKAALKIVDTCAARHLSMREVYWGGTLDAICEDKEGAWAAFQAFLAAYDISSDRRYLDYAKHAAYVALSYTVVWKIDMPPSRMGDAAFNSVGWTAVSPQNEHLDVYGVLYTPQLYRLGVLLGDSRLRRLSAVMFLSCGQLIDENGSQGEQIQQTNFAQHKKSLKDSVYSFRGGYAENWTVFWITAHFLNAAAQLREMEADFIN